MTPEAKPNQGQGESPQILREETIVPKRIRMDTARLSAIRLLTSLRDLGAEDLSGDFTLYNAGPFKRTYFGENRFTANMTFWLVTPDTHMPGGRGRVYGSDEFIVDRHVSHIRPNSTLCIDANLRFNNEPVRMHTAYVYKDNHRVTLVMPVTISANREVLLESLPPGFSTAAFSYDFVRNPEYRDRLASVAQKRVPVEVVNGNSPKSGVTGQVTPAGIDTRIQLNLQNPNPENHLKCYEVEIFDGDNKNAPQTTDVAPETIWQPQENHYCMVGGESYPLIPVKLNEISKLKMEIYCWGGFPKLVADLLGDLPVSIDGTNQWYVTMKNSEGSLELFFKPEWGEKNAALVFNKVSSKRISPKAIHGALMRMDTVRKSLAERLAA